MELIKEVKYVADSELDNQVGSFEEIILSKMDASLLFMVGEENFTIECATHFKGDFALASRVAVIRTLFH
jgi:hypothetical protein